MEDKFDFELIERKPQFPQAPAQGSGADHLQHAVAENFDRVLDCARIVVESKALLAQADAYSAKVDADCRKLAQETKAYVDKLEAESKSKLAKGDLIRHLLQDYYKSGQAPLSSQDFSAIVSQVIDRYDFF